MPIILRGPVKVPSFSYQKRLYSKGYLNLAKKILKSFSPGVFNRFCVTRSKSNNNGNLEPKSELIILFLGSFESFVCQLRQLMGNIEFNFFWVTPKTRVFNSDTRSLDSSWF